MSTQSDGGQGGWGLQAPRQALGPWAPSEPNREGMRSPRVPEGAWVEGEAAEECSRKISTW